MTNDQHGSTADQEYEVDLKNGHYMEIEEPLNLMTKKKDSNLSKRTSTTTSSNTSKSKKAPKLRLKRRLKEGRTPKSSSSSRHRHQMP